MYLAQDRSSIGPPHQAILKKAEYCLFLLDTKMLGQFSKARRFATTLKNCYGEPFTYYRICCNISVQVTLLPNLFFHADIILCAAHILVKIL